MPSRIDDKFTALRNQGFTGSVSDMVLQWLQANGASSNDVTDAWKQVLSLQLGVAATGDRNTDWYQLLGVQGFIGAYADREAAFWAAGGVLGDFVNAGGPYTTEVDVAVQLNGGAFFAADPTPVFAWTIVSGGTGTFLPSAAVEDPTFTPDDSGPYVLRLTVTPTPGVPLQDDANLTSNVRPLFLAALQSTLTPEFSVGSPTPTFSRASVASLFDYLGKYRKVAVDIPRFKGARLDPDNITYHATKIDGVTPIGAGDFFADAGGPFGYFAEGASTNYGKQSNNFLDAVWQTSNTTMTAETVVGPDGNVGCYGMTNVAGGDVLQFVYQAHFNVNNVSQACAFIVKKGGLDWVQFTYSVAGAFGYYVNFNLATGAIGSTNMPANSYTITALYDGWYLIKGVFVGAAVNAGGLLLPLASDIASRAPAAPRTGSVTTYVWSYMSEISNNSSSLIETGVATASRSGGSLSYVTTGNIPVNDFALQFEFVRYDRNGLNFTTMFDCSVDASNYLAVTVQSTSIIVTKRIAGVSHALTLPFSNNHNQVYKLRAEFSSTTGMKGFIDDVQLDTNVNAEDCILRATFDINRRIIANSAKFTIRKLEIDAI